MADAAVSRTETVPDEHGVEEAGPFVAGGSSFVLRSAQSGLLAMLSDRLRDLRAPETGVRNGRAPDSAEVTVFRIARRGPSWLSHPWGLWRDGEPCETVVTDDYIVAYVLWEVTRLVLERAAPLIPVHAAAVARDGRALMLVGPSHAGKSTLSASLTRAGWEFLTDELALLDIEPTGAVVHPFWRPIGIRRGGPLDVVIDLPGHEQEVLVPASDLGRLASPTPLAAIVFPTYVQGGDGRLEPLSPAVALAQMTTQMPGLGAEGGTESFHRCAALLDHLPAYAVAVDDLEVAEGNLRELLRHDRRASARRPGDHGVTRASGAVEIPEMPQPRSGIETAFLAPEAVLLDTVTGTSHHLNAGASAVWMLLDGSGDVEDVARELAELFDRPVGGMIEEVRTAVADFAARGLLAGTSPASGREELVAAMLHRPPDP